MARSLPSLGLLSGDGLGGLLQDAISPKRLAELGWAGAGGAAGGVVASKAVPKLLAQEWVPEFLKARGWLINLLVGYVGGNVAWNWNDSFAKGLVGKMAGDATQGLLAEAGLLEGLGNTMFNRSMLQPLAPNVVIDRHQLAGHMAEVVPQGGIGEVLPQGGIGATVERVQSQPGIQPQFMPTFQGMPGVGTWIQ